MPTLFRTARPSAPPRVLQPVAPAHAPGWQHCGAALLGTTVNLTWWADDGAAGSAAAQAALHEMLRIDCALNLPHAGSEIARVNAAAGRHAVPLGDELFHLVARAIDFSDLSDGAFDITVAGVGRLYDYRLGIAPTAAALDRAREAVGWRHLELDRRERTLRFAHPRTCIDLGGLVRGHAIDSAVRCLADHGIAHALVSAGGDSRALGDRRGRPWTVGLRDPRRPGEVVAVLPVEDGAVATSGDHERFFERDGQRHHAVIDPRTGLSPCGLRSVTVRARNGLVGDALAKTVFVLGKDEGLALIERIPGVEAVVIDDAGRLHGTSGAFGARGAA